jgi:hypothetical protein
VSSGKGRSADYRPSLNFETVLVFGEFGFQVTLYVFPNLQVISRKISHRSALPQHASPIPVVDVSYESFDVPRELAAPIELDLLEQDLAQGENGALAASGVITISSVRSTNLFCRGDPTRTREHPTFAHAVGAGRRATETDVDFATL